MGPPAFGDQGKNRINLGHPLIPQQSPSDDQRPNRSLHWQAQDGESLLSDPHLKALQELGITMFTMPEDNKQNLGLGPPWFKHATPSLIPKVVTKDNDGKLCELPYVWFALLDNQPMVLGTAGKGTTIFGQRLTASLAPPPTYLSKCDDDNLNILYNDYPFNWAISFTLYRLRDPGVIGDVFSLRSSYGQLKALKHENDTLARLITHLQEEQEQHNKEIKEFTDDTTAVRGHLVATQVHTQITPLLTRLAVEGVIPNPIYPQYRPPTLPDEHPL